MKNILKQWANEAKRKNKKKHQLGWWVKLNAGDNEKNVEFFNHVSGADGGDAGVFSGVGDNGGGMGESIETAESEKQKNKYFLKFDEIEESKMNNDDVFYLEYDDLDVTYYDSDGDVYETYIRYDYKTDNASIEETLADFLLRDYPNLDDESGEKVYTYLDNHYDEVVDKYYDELLDKYRDKAREEAESGGYNFDDLSYNADDAYDRMIDDKLMGRNNENESLCERLNRMDCDTCGEFDLVNMYEACGLSEEEEKFLSDRLAEGATPSELCEYLEEKLMSDGRYMETLDEDTVKTKDDERVKTFKLNGITYKVSKLEDSIRKGGYVAHWEDDSDNGLGYDNRGWISFDKKNYVLHNEASKPIKDFMYVISAYDRQPKKSVADKLIATTVSMFGDDVVGADGAGINEDTVKRNGKWVNVGKDGKADSGKFRTKKEADAQRRAMYAHGYKGESLNDYETTDISSLDDVLNSLDLYGKRGRITESTEIDFNADDDTSYFNEEE